MNLTAPLLAAIAKLLSGATVRWHECQPDTCQRVYFANHTSHLDALVLWSSLPGDIRDLTRPVAAKDYWSQGRVRPYIARCFNAMLIDRDEIKVHQSPVDMMLREIGSKYSLIVFPEGRRNTDEEMLEFKSGLYYLSKKRPDLELMPVYIDNLNRVLPRGEFLPVPLLSSITIGPPVWLEPKENKLDFLKRARDAVRKLKDVWTAMPHALAQLSLLLIGQLRPNIALDARTNILLGSVLGALAVAFVVGRALRRQPESTLSPAVIRTFNLRIWAWWLMFVILVAGLWLGYVPTVVFFGLISFWALREFITMTPTRRGDHRTLFWTFVVFTPLQYVLVGLGREYYNLYTVMIPVYASLFIPARIAIAGDPKRFLERVAKIQAGLLICVYCLSHAPAILDLKLTGPDGQPWVLTAPPAVASPMDERDGKAEPSTNETASSEATPAVAEQKPPDLRRTASVLFFFVLIVQMNDVFQYMWGQLLGKHVIAPQINASRTWEGLIGGVLSTMLLGMLLSWATPYGVYWAGPIAGAVAFAGFAGSMTMSAIKRDRGVKDYGTLVSGHAGVLDRIDSLCFAAPVFFHLTRFFFSTMQ